MWNLPPPPGFQGLNPEKPLTIYQCALPHWRQDGATYFVTFRLGDSLPQSRLRELESFQEDWERRFPAPQTREIQDEFAKEKMRRIERWLDEGSGSCSLRIATVRRFVVEAMGHFEDSRYELGCAVVMPNHVHALVRPLHPIEFPLESIVGSWKSHSARRINEHLSLSGMFWQEEAFDRIIRDEEHLWRSVQYIGRNPRMGKLGPGESSLCVRSDWAALGWTFENFDPEL